MNIRQPAPAPTIFVVFGATGDLMAKKIVPSLYHLWSKQKLPERFSVVGVSRQAISNEDFVKRVSGILAERVPDAPEESREKFASLFRYSAGYFNEASTYEALARELKKIDDAWGTCSNKLFYFAVAPSFYKPIAQQLSDSGLTAPCGGDMGWTRVIVEKPFGNDLKTAEELDEFLGSLFKESQIYRIDHYLAKEMLQNILTFRFSNNLFEKGWGTETIESVEIRLLEKIGAEDRGAFYDGVGTLRDVGQNHLLQMLALVAMDLPSSYEADSVRAERARLLHMLLVPSEKEVEEHTVRAQYEGYRKIPGVAPDSMTETYFKARGFLNHPKWRGVPITFESGKRMGEPVKDVIVTFKHPSPCLCPADQKEHFKNRVIFSVEPREQILVEFWSKKPGLALEMEKRDLVFEYRPAGSRTQYTEEYEKLLLDCIMGDQTLFVSTDEIRAMWRFTDPISLAWAENKVPLRTYKPDSKDITREASCVSLEVPFKAGQEIGLIGLGKMGANIALRLAEHGWSVRAFDQNPDAGKNIASERIVPEGSIEAVVKNLKVGRVVWLMLPSGKPVDEAILRLLPILEPGDTIIDGGNSFYKDSVRRAEQCAEKGIKFLDVGVSGGPAGARNGACLMIGGALETYESLHPLFEAIARPRGYGRMGSAGAGHFVKMVHNGIEYGMMQAIAEGFEVMKKADLNLGLTEITRLYNTGSVVESRLVGWLKSAYEQYGEDLESITSTVAHSGEGLWTVETAKEFGIPVPVIEASLVFRKESAEKPSYTGKVLSALRNQFGGHKA